ncbi:MAG: hypothetical protein IKV87_06640 [Methanobrevibacter sp.]|nr:hypothetical protein [Methanobrevibacter sp.]
MIFTIILLSFCLISSISASELSDNELNPINYDDAFSSNDSIMQSDDNSVSADNYNPIGDNIQKNNKNFLSESKSIYVSTIGSDDSGDGSKDKPYQSIRYAIEKSDNDSTIYLANGTYNGENNQKLSVDKTLTIKGESRETTIIDGEDKSQLFLMNSNAKLTLIGLCLTNAFMEGNESENGGAIINEGGQLTLINSTIKDSYGNYNGGAIYNNMGRLNIINSRFINNSAIQYGGCIYTLGITNIDKSYFQENFITAEKGVGGTIAAGGVININNTDFIRNHAIYSAAALLSLGNATIDNCNFINQTTQYTAGAISNHGNMFINNSLFYGGEARFYAGAILAPPSGHHVFTEVYNTVFDNNHVGNHGAVTNNFKDAELIMDKCAIINNYIQKNVFYGDIALDDNASVQYCWWGQNTISPYYYSPHSENEDPGQINASRWLVMDFTSSNEIIENGTNNVLTVSLKHYFDNETKEIYEYNEDLNLPLTVKFYTDSKQLIASKVLKNGTVSISYSPKDNVKAVYAQLTNQTLEIPVVTKNESKLIVKNLTKYYKNESQLEVLLTDGNDNPLPDKKIVLELLGKEYTKTTDENGKVKLNINLKGGNYTVNVNFKDEAYSSQNAIVNVIVLKNKTNIVAKNLVKYYKNSTQLSVKLVDKNNNKALASKKVKLTIDGKTYTQTTNSKGIAKFTINQKAKAYQAKISFKEDQMYKASSKTVKITVKAPKISTKTKKIHRNSNFVAIFKDANGKAIKNTKVKFTLNGKTFIKTTNSKGEAKLKISLKLGSYTVKSQFKSTNPYGATQLSTKIKVIK